ncbi:MAG: hypothetical protein QXW82_07575 [Candidatus Bathyarchaeia archaeon]
MKWYYWVGIVVAVILGISTLIPVPAGKISLLGYKAHCPFAPISTIICWAIAGIIYWFGRKREIKPAKK